MSTQQQDKVREPPLSANGGGSEDGLEKLAEETRRVDYEQTHRKRRGWVQTEPVSDRNRTQPTNDGLSEVCGGD